MGWEPVPYFVGGGAEHSAEIMRLVANEAVHGNGGVGSPLDLKVKALTVPGAAVTVDPGSMSAINRAVAQPDQSYIARMPSQDQVAVAAQGASGIRYDLVVGRVEDPWLAGEPWQDPVDPKVGPYVATRIISGVPQSVVANPLAAAAYLKAAGYTAEALGGIAMRANSGTVLQTDIIDLRRVANPRRQFEREHMMSTTNDTLNLLSPSWEQFPNGVWFYVDVPDWAVVAKVSAFVEGLRLLKAGTGALRVGINGQAGVATQATNINEAQYIGGGYDRRAYNLGGSLTIPAALRGTRCIFEVQGQAGSSGSAGFLTTDALSSGLIDLVLEERAV